MKQILFPFDEAYFSGFVCHEIWQVEKERMKIRKKKLNSIMNLMTSHLAP
jgi:hypothetical protein